MSLRLAILCPGQGGQHRQMFDLPRSNSAVAARLAAWHLPSLDDLFANRSAQPLIVAAGCATWEALHDLLPKPHAIAGYSVGEVTALAVAGVLGAQAAINLAGERARAMDACVDPARPQGLLAVSGLTMDKVAPVLTHPAPRSAPAGMYLAIENGADQLILGGPVEALAVARGMFETLGGKAHILPVAVASHTPWMQDAVPSIVECFHGLATAAPIARLLSGVTADPIRDAGHAIEALASQTICTVRWSRCMDALAESGVTAALELGPGAALSRMLSLRHPHIACRSVADFRTLDGISGWLMRQL